MRHTPVSATRYFFTTAPMPCPYLAERVERRVVTDLSGRDATEFNDNLSLVGFRRSHTIAYAPACDDCDACQSVRIPVARFAPSRTQRRILARNADLIATDAPPVASAEQYALFDAYIQTRHGDGDMASMNRDDYQSLIEETPVATAVHEFRDATGRLVAACLIDRLERGLSAVYSFFDPGLPQRSLGTYMILWLVEKTRMLGLEHVYLGYWVAGSPKMDYKRKFHPIEGHTAGGWATLKIDNL